MKEANRLINESSPYLLQHAYNPVDWYPWGEEALKRAREENKLLIISIGYSACHWCHVMEHESFEDYEVADLMNSFFICVKVDREERPDLDQVYMSAVQLMTGRGGWPLNCFALPDGSPVYGGTYFNKAQWIHVLQQMHQGFKSEPGRFRQYADELKKGVAQMNTISLPEQPDYTANAIRESVINWKAGFDNINGGPNRAPKFPMPGNYLFLLAYGIINKDEDVIRHVKLTLEKMALGGICDQLGGGFARYSVDGIWKVPHFEKMLYDNAQLLRLYSEAYRYFKDDLFRETAYGIFNFIETDLKGEKNNYYSALDADSEGVEGKYYIWNEVELKELLSDDYPVARDYFNINENGFWEHDSYILLREYRDEQVAENLNISLEDLKETVERIRTELIKGRSKRVRPGLDDKTLTSWNALTVTGMLTAYNVFNDEKFLTAALKCGKFISETLTVNGNQLFRSWKKGKSTINGFLEDYAFVIECYILLYQATFNKDWIEKAVLLTEYSIAQFSEYESGFFYYTSQSDSPLFSRQMEIQDNVIPSSNSQMALNLFLLGTLTGRNEWVERSGKMVKPVIPDAIKYGGAYSTWLFTSLLQSKPLTEVVVCGVNALQVRGEFLQKVQDPLFVLSGCIDEENIPPTQQRLKSGETLIYVCHDHTCKLPVTDVSEAIKAISAGA